MMMGTDVDDDGQIGHTTAKENEGKRKIVNLFVQAGFLIFEGLIVVIVNDWGVIVEVESSSQHGDRYQ